MIEAYYMDDDEDCLTLAQILTDLQAEHPDNQFRFCTHDTDNAIGILQYSPNASLTSATIADAWYRQAQGWIADEDPKDFSLDHWIAGWTLIEPSEESDPQHA
jgi:hypothetical protein